MKKNLIALAVLAASGVASAQSSVTLYGAADVWFGSVKQEISIGGVKVANGRDTLIQSGGIDDSFFGFKGSEDLGGGLKANFVLEQGFTIDDGAGFATFNNATGAPANATFGRQAYVGFSSGFGEVRVGKTFTPFDEISGATTPGFDSALAPTANGVWLSAGYNANPNNTLYYATPSLSGFSGAVSYSLGENKDVPVAGVKAGKIASFNVKYQGGPVYAGLAYQTEKADGATPAVKFTRLNGSYDLGVAKLLAGYGRVAVGNFKTNEWQIGADVPVSSALTLSAGYARSKANGVLENSGVGVVAHYALSKRTAAYGGVHASKIEIGATELKTNIYAVGVRHTF
ncbi:MAG: porin [Pseudomonadota bacterium]|nr:porin [Pseudomonadota bacterium]